MTRPIGGFITATNRAPNASSAKGIWTLDNAMQYTKAGLWPGPGDLYFSNVTLLLPGNGTNSQQNNTFLDSSTNNITITRNGNPTQGTFSPFASTAAYVADVNGGSAYFDGSGDYLNAAYNSAYNVGTGDFTAEAWIYPMDSTGVNGLFGNHPGLYVGGFCLFLNDLVPYGQIFTPSTFSADGATGTALVVNTWSHVAFVRSSGYIKVYVNGIGGTAVSSARNPDNTQVLEIGRIEGNPSYSFTGYISNFRFVKGTAVYTANFTPPTAPVTAIANTSLLCNFTNAGIIDNAMKNNLETVGNAQISTAQSKFGGSSLYFDGTGDYLLAGHNSNSAFGSGDFTIEAWIYITSNSPSEQHIYGKRATASNYSPFIAAVSKSGTAYRIFYIGSLNSSSWGINGSFSKGNIDIPLNTWTHVAYVRNGTTITGYVNGVADLVVTGISGTLLTNLDPISIGASTANGAAPFFGYIDDFRITKGIARYTANFTPPAVLPKNGV